MKQPELQAHYGNRGVKRETAAYNREQCAAVEKLLAKSGQNSCEKEREHERTRRKSFGQRARAVGIAERDEQVLPNVAHAYGDYVAKYAYRQREREVIPFGFAKVGKLEHAAHVLFERELIKQYGHNHHNANLHEHAENKIRRKLVFYGQIVGYKPNYGQRHGNAKSEKRDNSVLFLPAYALRPLVIKLYFVSAHL